MFRAHQFLATSMRVVMLTCFSFLAATCGAVPVPPGIKAGLYGDMVAKSDFTLKLEPPAEKSADVADKLDAVLASEEAQRNEALAELSTQKRDMLKAERAEIARIVGAAFAARSRSASFVALEPVAALADQPVWQAGKPVPVTVAFDVPAYGASTALSKLQAATSVEAQLAKKASGGIL